MTKSEIISNTIDILNSLDEAQIKEVNDFAQFIYRKYEDKLMTKGIHKLSSSSLDFLENEPENYTESDLKVKY
ncbi:MAG: hypothetical protein ACLFSQ_02240 [Candidatus Zixiibacteriota bacterium]